MDWGAECPIEDFHLQVSAPCRAHKKRGRCLIGIAPFEISVSFRQACVNR